MSAATSRTSAKAKDSTQPKRRYSPDVRRSMILDAAAEMVALEGISNLSLERIAHQEGVSKSLIYKYFTSLSELLSELLDRELKTLRKRQAIGAEKAETFSELVRNVTHEYLDYIKQRGLIIERLQADPTISRIHDPTDYLRQVSVDYIAAILEKNFAIPIDIAKAVTDISFGLPASAGSYLLRNPELDSDELEDLTVAMIIGSVNGVRQDFMMSMRKLER
jgi:AcrR family transcriptional regulator